MRWVGGVGAMVTAVAIAGCGSSGSAELGEPCKSDDNCIVANAICGREGFCTQRCVLGSGSCPSPPERTLVCREDMLCGSPCDFSGVRDGFVCDDSSGTVRPCEDPARDCEACGCEVFGGGVCEPGTGCVDPMPNGSECTRHELCESDLCDPETGLCREPAAEGEPCRYDAQCVTSNCTSDGDVEVEGECAPELGSECDRGSTTCTRCIRSTTIGPGLCSRRNCDPETHPNCPEDFDCVLTTDGDHACFQRCDSDFMCIEGVCFSDDEYCD